MASVSINWRIASMACVAITVIACDGSSAGIGLPPTINQPVATENTDILLGDDISANTVGTQNCQPLTGDGNVGEIAGLWDTTEVVNGFQDIALTQIRENGEISFFDFQQDDIGNGDNCYVIVTGTSVLDQVSDSEFVNFFYSNLDISCELQADELDLSINADGSLDISSIEEFNGDNDGNTDEITAQTFPRINGVSVTDLIACEI